MGEVAITTDTSTRAVDDLRRLGSVPVELSVEIGRARMTVAETLELRPGSIVTLNRLADEPVDLLVNGTTIAHGEVVVVDEDFALRITEVLDEDVEAETMESITADRFDQQDISIATLDAEPILPEPDEQVLDPENGV